MEELGVVVHDDHQPFAVRRFLAFETGRTRNDHPSDFDESPDISTAVVDATRANNNSELNSSPPRTPNGVEAAQRPRGAEDSSAAAAAAAAPPPAVVAMPGKSKERQYVVNRRKSAKPQWVFEGTVLDRSNYGQPSNGYDSLQLPDSRLPRELGHKKTEPCMNLNGETSFSETVREIST